MDTYLEMMVRRGIDRYRFWLEDENNHTEDALRLAFQEIVSQCLEDTY
jgi:hypothetical protein